LFIIDKLNLCIHELRCFSLLENAVFQIDHIDLKEETMLKVPGYAAPVQFGVLIYFAYPLEGLGEIVVATTRIETMLGDTAIAIHPEDKRYQHLHGRYAIHPFNGRKLKIICDAELVDPTFGTGAVKVGASA
jgi:valyl-tRNA synthetase